MERRAPFVLAWILFLLGTSVGQDDAGRIKGRTSSAVSHDLIRSLAPPKNRASVFPAAKVAASIKDSHLPLSFEANQGQAPGAVKFLARGSGYQLVLTDAEALLQLNKAQSQTRRMGSDDRDLPSGTSAPPDWLRIAFDRPSASAAISGEDELPGKSNYFIGNDPRKWRSGISNYARVRYRQVYPGVDLVYYGNQGRLEYDFVVAPGARPEQIGLRIDGASKLELDSHGDLVLSVGGSSVRLQKPRVYQEVQGTRREIAGGYVLEKDKVKFRLGDYDHRQALVIDPILSFSTYFGGSDDDLYINGSIDGAITLDSGGNIYVAGQTLSTSFPFFPPPNTPYKATCGTDGSCNSTTGGPFSDVFIAKLNPTASAVLAFTYLGGSSQDIVGSGKTGGGLVVDSTGVYVGGTTFSSDFPTTSGVFHPACTNAAGCNTYGDGFVSKLDVNLSTLIFSTYLSGNGTSQAGQIQVDSLGDVYVIGQAESGYPAASAISPCSPAQTCSTGFITELNSTATAQVFSDFLGGSGQDYVEALALDANNNLYVAGMTTSTDFPGSKALLPAATSGGIYSTTNTTTWTALNSGLTGLGVMAVTFNPSTPTTLLAATRQGIFQSTNSGTSWTLVSFVSNFSSIAFDPINPLNVYAGTADGVNAVIKSTDGGTTWGSITLIPGSTAGSGAIINAVAADPVNEGTVYAGTSKGLGLWKSTNGGTTWTQIPATSGLTAGNITAIAIDSTNSANVYVGSVGQGVFASTNGGANWAQINSGLSAANNGVIPGIRALTIDPNSHTTLYAGTSAGAFKTTNSGGTWTQISRAYANVSGSAAGPVNAIAVDPANSQNVYVGAQAVGVLFSSNGGSTFAPVTGLGPQLITSFALHAVSGSPTTVYVGTGYEFGYAAKINSGGGSLAYATLLGGNDLTFLHGIALDSSNNVYLAGQTYASNFPVSASAFQQTLAGFANAVVAKLASAGNSLTYASYLGGSNADVAYSIALDSNQDAWITGATSSDNFPLANAVWLQSPGNAGASNEGFITEFNPTGSGLLLSTYLGGEGNCNQNCNGIPNSEGVNIAVDASGNAYVIGFTNDSSFDTANALQSSLGGGYDAFISKIGVVSTVTDLSICMLNSSGQCTTTPPAAELAGVDFPVTLQVTNKSTTTPATGVVVGGRGGDKGIRAVACTITVGICEADTGEGNGGAIPDGGFASLGTMAPGAVAQITVTLRGEQAGSFVITVDVRENETDANPADNTASTTFTILAAADLAATISESPSPVQSVPANVTYTVGAANLGPSNASNVTAVITFTPATSVTFGTLLPGCTNTSAGTLTCAVGAMAAGSSGGGSFTVTLTALPVTATLTLSNTPEPDPNPANNTASVTTTAQERLLLDDVDSSSVLVLDPSSTNLLETVEGGTDAEGFAVSPNRRLAFGGNLNATYLSVLDLTIGKEIQRIQGVRAARNVALSADGSILVVPDLDKDDVAVLDPVGLQIVSRVGVSDSVGANPGSIGVASVVIAGTQAFVDDYGVNSAGTGGLPLAVVNLETLKANPVNGTSGGGFGIYSSSLAVTPDNSTVLSIRQSPNTLWIINAASASVTQTVSLPWIPYGIAVTPNGTNPASVFGYIVHSTDGVNFIASVLDLRTGSATYGQMLTGADVTLPTGAWGGDSYVPMAVSLDGTQLAIGASGSTTGTNVAILNTALMQSSPASSIVTAFHAGNSPSAIRSVAYALVDNGLPPATAPTVTAVSVAVTNNVATPITLTGTNFAPGAVVRIGKMNPIAAANVTSTSLSVTVPQNAPAQIGADIIVTNPTPASGTVTIDTEQQSGLLAGTSSGFTIFSSPSFHPLNQVLNSNFGDNTESLLDLANKVNTTIPVGLGPMGPAATPDGQYAYVESFRSTNIQAINLSTQTVAATIALPSGAFEAGQNDAVAIAPNPATGNNVAYVLFSTFSGSTFDLQVAMIDANPASATFNTIIRTLAAGLNNANVLIPGGLAVTSDGNYLYANEANQGLVVVFNVAAGTATALSTTTLGVNSFQGEMYVTPDNNSLLMADASGPVDVFDISASRTNPTLVTKIAGSAPTGGVAPNFGAYRVLGTQLFAFDSYQQLVEAFNFNRSTANFSQLGSYVIPGNYNEFFADLGITPDGLLLYAQLHTDDAVAVLDAQGLASGSTTPLITELATGLAPSGLAINPVAVPEPDLSATLTATPSTAVLPGGNITYTVTINNARSAVATGVIVETVIVPAVTISGTNPAGCTTESVAQGTAVLCSVASVTQGTPVTVTVTAVAPATGLACPASALGCVSAVATVTETQIDYNPTDNTSAVVTTPVVASGTTACTGTTTNWVGGTGNWSNAAMWSTGVVPNSSSVNVCIADGNPAASQVTLDINAQVANLYIDNNASLIISNSNTLTPVSGTISNAGTITIAAGANNTFLSIDGPVTLTGGGTLTLSTSGSGTAIINEACNCSAALTNVNNTILGVGLIGDNGLPFTNQAGGTVNANGAGTLEINGSVTNLGTMEAAGGTLQLNNITVTNASGTIAASGSGSNVQLVSTAVRGGTLSTSGGGVLGVANGNTATVDGSTASGQVTINGTYTTGDAASTVLAGTINNLGNIQVNAVADATELRMSGPVTLTGGGTLTLATTGNGTPIINENCNCSASLTNVNNIIQGVGQIGNNGLPLTNQAAGIINANVAGANLLVLNGGTATNQGLMTATAGGTLQLSGTTVVNAAATISASGISATAAASTVQVLNATIQGGTINTAGGGVFGAFTGTATLDGSTASGAVNNLGTYTTFDGSTTVLLGTINNAGTLLVNAVTTTTQLRMDGPVSLTGGGTLTLASTAPGTAVVNEDCNCSATLTNASNVIQGSGVIGNNGLPLVNQATINANISGQTLTINGSSTTNAGVMQATGGGTLALSNNTINNQSGMIMVNGANSAVQFVNNVVIQGGTLSTANGGVLGSAASQSVTLDGRTLGTLTNSGTYTAMDGSQTILLGTIANPGTILVNAVANPTELRMNGAVSLSGAGTLTLSGTTTGGTAYVNEACNCSAALTNVGNTIQGAGVIGNNGLPLVNQATINANVPGQGLTINGSSTTNAGLLEATGGGTLALSNNVIGNQNGTITVNGATSAVQFTSNVTIQGGALNTLNGGVLGAAAGQTVTLDGHTLGTLTNNGTYTAMDGSQTVWIGTIANPGTFLVSAVASPTELRMDGPVNLTGTGTVTMSTTGAGTAYINADCNCSAMLTNVGNTIQGAGVIGNNGLPVVNQATINASTSGQTLTLNGGSFTNAGLLEATGGGILALPGDTINNQNGTITVNGATSAVQLSANVTIQGGTLTTLNGGAFGATSGQTVTLDGSTLGALTNNGTFSGADGSQTVLLGTFNNLGTFKLNAVANPTELRMSGPVILTGGGTVTMTSVAGAGTAIINADCNCSASLTNVNNLIQGAGQIGNNGLPVTNQATINANVAGLALTLNGGTLTNPGLLEATGGALLQLISTTFANAGGTIAASGSGSTVQLVTADIQGGTLATASGGVFTVPMADSSTLDGSTGNGAVNITGTLTLADATQTVLLGTINNTGAIQVNAVADATQLRIDGPVSLTGAGTVTLSTTGAGTALINADCNCSAVLTNVGNTIQGVGVIGNNGLPVVNVATITAELSSAGTYTQTAGSTLVAASTSASVSSVALSGGVIQVDGTLSSPGGVSISGTGLLQGGGTVSGAVSNGGVVQPGDSPGVLAVVNGNYTQTSAGSLNIVVGGTTAGTQYSELNAMGTAALAGTLNVSLINGFIPVPGDSFTIVTAGSISGTFATVNLPTLSNGVWQVTYSATTVVLAVNASSASGNIYTTGFENPPFVLGPLAGQNGWQVLGSTAVQVENTVVQSGSQAVSVDGSATSQSGPYLTINPDAGPLVELSAGIYIASASSQSEWQFAGLGPSLAPYIGGVNVLASGQIQAITAGFPNVGTWTYNAWNNLDFLFNIGTQTYTINLNGVTVASGVPFCGDNGPCAGAAVSSYGTSIFDTFGGGTDTGYIDNFSLTGPSLGILSISPASATLGSAAFTLTVNGAGFVSGATVNFNGSALTTTFVSASQLTATVPASDLTTAGSDSITVTNPSSGGTSNAVTFTVNNPVPVIASLSPSSAVAGGSAFTLTVNGLPATSGGNATVQATDVIYAAGTQSSLAAGISGTVPGAISISPDASSVSFTSVRGSLTGSACGSPEGCITLNGNGNENDPDGNLSAVASSSNTGSGSISGITGPGAGYMVGVFIAAGGPSGEAPPALDFTSSGIGTSFTTLSPLLNQVFFIGDGLTGDGTGTVQTFEVPAGAAQLYLGISDAAFYNGAPGSYGDNSGSYAVAYTVANGSPIDFVNGSIVNFNGSPRETTFVNGMQLTAAILASDIPTAGTANVTVTTPAPGGGTSAPAAFTISTGNPTPTISSISPTSAATGSAQFTLTVNGTGFISTSTVNFAGNALATTFVSATQLTAVVPAADLVTAGIFNVTVITPAPGGGTSNAVPFTVGNVADVAVTMTATPSPVPVLGSVTYQITITNNGPSTATGVTLTDALPAVTVFASIVDNSDNLAPCTIASSTLTCSFGSVAVGSPVTVNLILVPLAVPDGGTYDNTVNVVANETDPNLANNTATQTVQVTGTTPPGGGAFRNLPGFSTNILSPNDDNSTPAVPIGFSLNFFGSAPVSSAYINNNGNVTFDSPLSTFTPFLLTTTTQQIIAPFFSDVDTEFGPSGLVTYGNDTVNGNAAFGVSWPNVWYYGEGGDGTNLYDIFQVVLINRPDVAAGDFDIEFNFDKIQWETGDASGGTDGLGGTSAAVGYSNGSQTAATFFELAGSLVPGSFLDSNATTGLIYNSLNSTQPGRFVFQIRGGAVQSSADMSITGTGPASASIGVTVSYTFTVTNNGPNTATGVVVTNTLPVGFIFVPAGSSGICSSTGPAIVTCNIGTMANGANTVITIQATVPATASGTVSDVAVVSVPNNQDLNLANNTASVPTTILIPDLTITKTHSDPFAQGQVGATYTITVSNVGGGQSSGTVTVSDSLPAGLTATSISGTGDSNWSCTLAPLGCTRGDALAASSSYDPITLTVNVASTAAVGQVTNTATVAGGGEVNTSNDTANDVTNIVTAAASLVPTVAVMPSSDSTSTTITYTITITNNGPSAATSVTLTDQITGSASFFSVGSETMTCPSPGATSLSCTQAVLNNGASATVTVTVTLTGGGWDVNTIGVTSPVPNPNPIANLGVQKASAGGNTGTGTNVAVQPVDSASGQSPAVVTFRNVTRGGTTTLVSSSTGTAPPGEFRTGTPSVFYNLATTAGYTGTIGIGLNFNNQSFHHAAKVRLFHLENGSWVDRTVAVSSIAGYAAAAASSLSSFALFEPIDHAPVANPGPASVTQGTSVLGASITLSGAASYSPEGNPLTYTWTGPFPQGNGTVTGLNPTVTMPLGTNLVTLVVSDGELSSAPVTQSVTVTAYSLAATATSPTTISAGSSVGFNVTAIQLFGPFPAPISLACSGLPQGAQCNFSAASVTAGGSAVALSITTTPRNTAALAPIHRTPAPLYTLWMPLPAIALMGFGIRRRSRKRAAALMLLLMLGMMMLLASCGGGSMVSTPVTQTGTPAGTYTITVTGTASTGLQNTVNVSFTVQ